MIIPNMYNNLVVYFVIIILIIFIMYIYWRNSIEINLLTNTNNNIINDSIKTTVKNINNEPELLNFIFSIQDFYIFNPQAFEEFTTNINDFLELHDMIYSDSQYCHYYYDIVINKKQDILNSFHSLIYKLPNNKLFTQKLNKSMIYLQLLLTKIINKIHDYCTSNIIKYGYNVTTKMTSNNAPYEYNKYLDQDFTYQFY